MKKHKKTFFEPSQESYNVQEDFNEDEEAARNKWYEEIAPDPKNFEPVTEGTLIELKDEAKKHHDAEVAAYNIKSSKTNTNYKWMKGVMSKGTATDKLAAYTVLIQDNPVSNVNTLRNIIGMVKPGKKKDCLTAIQNLTELFMSDLLRPNEKLKAFHQRPLSMLTKLSSGNVTTRKKFLIYWYFEDQLKESYTSFVMALNSVAHDTVDASKEKAIGAIFKLLAGNPEQEKNLLMYLVNKLGDPSQKVSSKAIYCLTQLLKKHPNMQGVVLTEVEKLLFRPNVSTRAQYYGVCFLSQYILSHEDSEVAKRLIEVYFSFFKACIKKGEVDSRMMSALLMGVNRAYPYAKMQLDNNSEHIQTMYKIVHIANFNVGIHALSLLYQVSDLANNVNDRFYSALYRKMLDTRLLKTTHQAMLLNLVYKALMKDTQANRIKVFIKRLLQMALYVLPNFACGILFLISQIISKKVNTAALDLIPMKIDELEDEDDGEEKYVDIKDEPLEEEEAKTKSKQPEPKDGSDAVVDLAEVEIKPEISNDGAPKPGWYHCQTTVKKENNHNVCEYRPLHRNPLYAGGEFTCYVELNHLRNHFHPSVSLFASQILNGETIIYTGDPLKDFTLIRFLDRFVFKNPKKREDISKQGAHPTLGKRKQYLPKGLRALSVTSNGYLNESEENIPAEERFMYNFLQKRRKAMEAKKAEEESDLESVGSEDFNDMLDKMGGDQGLDEEDYDFDEDVKEHLKSKKSKKKGADEEEEDDEDLEKEIDDIEDIDEEDIEGDDLGSDDDIEDFDGEDLDDNEMDDDDSDIFINDDEPEDKKSNKKRKSKTPVSDFAPAEEFAALLEDEGASMFKPGSSNMYLNKDKSAVKQIAWEDKRNHWLKGFNKKGGKKRPHQQKPGKNKKFKKS